MMPKGLIYLCQPGYGAGHAGSHKAFWTADSGTLRGRLCQVVGKSSLLANLFNTFWSHALSLRDAFKAGEEARARGTPLDRAPYEDGPDHLKEHWTLGWKGEELSRVSYFAMLHDDVAPEPGWLETLMEDMVSSGADLVSALIPIKIGNGTTSTAISDSRDRFAIHRHVTLAEACSLPQVFMTDDLEIEEGRLLCNTGCWIVRLDLPFLTDQNIDGSLKLRFTIDDEIRWDEKNRAWKPRVVSEDWGFSRDFQKLGGKVAVTWRVKLSHWGSVPFANQTV